MLGNEKFDQLRVEWLGTLRRTDYFKHPDTDPPCIPEPAYDEAMTISRAIDNAAGALEVTRDLLFGDHRRPEMCRKRYIFYRVMAEKFPMMARSMLASKIHRDPTTLATGLRRSEYFMRDEDFRAEYLRVKRELG